MTVLVIGNCQARVLAHIMSTSWGLEAQTPIVQFRSKPEEEADHLDAMEAADIILVQLTADNFPVAHLRSSAVAARFPGKTAIWPNLFYSGQQPFLRYLAQPGFGRLAGPLDVYHDLQIFLDWRVSRGLAAARDLDTGVIAQANHDASLGELAAREQRCSVGVSDIIADLWRQRRLFFAFNHPTLWLMEQLGQRIGAHLGLQRRSEPASRREFLDRVVAPSISLPENSHDFLRGFEIDLLDGGQVGTKTIRQFSPEELRASCFAAYDHIADHVGALTLRPTPDYGLDTAFLA